MHLFVFNPSFGTKEGVRAGHAQVHSQDWAACLSPGCHGSAALVWVILAHICRGFLPICGVLSQLQRSYWTGGS